MSEFYMKLQERFSDDVRSACARRFVETGSLDEAAWAGEVPHGLVRWWSENATWWKERVSYYRSDRDGVLSARLAAIARKALEEIEDRVSQGDEKLHRDGSLVRVKVPAKDLAVIAGIALTARKQIEHTGPSTGELAQSLLEKLAEIGKRVGLSAETRKRLESPEAEPVIEGEVVKRA